MQQYVLQYVQVALGQKWPSFFFFSLAEPNLRMLPQYINIMYELDSIKQKFDVRIGANFCWIMRQGQSNVRQKCGSRFRRQI